MNIEWVFNGYYTLIAATIVLLIGKLLVAKIKVLQNFNIPEPVAGGLIAALVLYILHAVYGVSFKFEKSLQDAFMLIFFASIGLSADFSRLKAGGFPLILFTGIVGFFYCAAKSGRCRPGRGARLRSPNRSDNRLDYPDRRPRHGRRLGACF